jgi:FMN phosphatase YigB (HAD superfamily)
LAPNLPADLRAHSESIDSISKRFTGVLAKDLIEEWIMQFEPEHRQLAIRLASNVLFFTQADVTKLCKRLYATLKKHNIENPCFVGFGNTAKSGSLVAYWFCKANGISSKRFIPFENVARRYGKHDAIVLIDDFLGTGDQAIDWLEQLSNEFGKLPPVLFLVLVGFVDAKEYVQGVEEGVHVEVAYQLTEMDRAFFPSGVFGDSYLANNAKGIFSVYGRELEPVYPLGYKDTQALVAFFYNTPNNTLPIFWSTNNNWTPLFERHESKQATTKSHSVEGNVESGRRLAAYSEFLNRHEAVLESECPDGKSEFEMLNSNQLAAALTVADQKLYSLPVLGVSAAVSSGLARISEIGRFCKLSPKTIEATLQRNLDVLTQASSSIQLRRRNWKLLVLDWSDTLVDEFDLDEAICSAICASARPSEEKENTIRFRELLTDLERKHSHLWYDYVYLAKQFGKTPKDLAHLHREFAHLLRPLCKIEDLISTIRQKGIHVALSTNCVSRVLAWRLDNLGTRADALFDFVVTSDVTKSVRDKGSNLKYLTERSRIPANETVVVGDCFFKDILPAKACGMNTIWLRRSFARDRSYWGTPELPVPLNVSEPGRAAVKGRAADFMIFDINHLVRCLLP